MNEALFEALTLISSFIVVIPLMVSLAKIKRLSTLQKKIALLLLVTLITEIISNILWYKKINNLPVYHIYTVLEFLLILSIYAEVLPTLLSKMRVRLLSLLFVLFAGINILILQGLFEFNSNTTTILSILVILLTLISFFQMLTNPNHSKLRLSPIFWINAGLLLYFSSNLILFYLTNKLDLTVAESYAIWGFHAIINCILIIFYTIALWIHHKKN